MGGGFRDDRQGVAEVFMSIEFVELLSRVDWLIITVGRMKS